MRHERFPINLKQALWVVLGRDDPLATLSRAEAERAVEELHYDRKPYQVLEIEGLTGGFSGLFYDVTAEFVPETEPDYDSYPDRGESRADNIYQFTRERGL